MGGFLTEFPIAVKQSADSIVDAAVEIYHSMSVDLLPTPAKSHYVFNLRDLSKCVQGKKHTHKLTKTCVPTGAFKAGGQLQRIYKGCH